MIYTYYIMAYSQEELIKMATDKLSNINNKNNLSVIPPKIEYKNHRTVFNNFIQVCDSIKRGDRGDIEHIKKYIDLETNMLSSLDTNNKLLIVGNIKLNKIQEIIKNYYNIFIKCKTCNSSNTTIIKKERLYYIKCDRCKSDTYSLKDY